MRFWFEQAIKFEKISFITEESNCFTFFSGKQLASMYNSFLHKPTWSLSNSPIDTIFICQVTKEIGVEDVVSRIKKTNKWYDNVKKIAITDGVSVDSMLVINATWLIDQKRKN
ncbi:MAG: hypothetical protein AB8B74_03025 [Crocinitomicaceae bacterium]